MISVCRSVSDKRLRHGGSGYETTFAVWSYDISKHIYLLKTMMCSYMSFVWIN